ncbi:MAG: hypothetical protein IM577_10515 [Chitinophagaceae bacterium]|nr:hypothetical protein [Chitinophagaceae bacterium]
MRKLFLLFFVSVTFSTLTNGQSFKVAVAPALSVPLGNLSEINGIGLGAEVMGILEVSEKFQAFGQIGTIVF